MPRHSIWIVIALAILFLALVQLAACTQENPPAVTSADPGGEVTQPTALSADPSPTPEPTSEPGGGQVEAAPAEQVDFCLDCHTDKERLIDTAKPVEEIVSESSGEG